MHFDYLSIHSPVVCQYRCIPLQVPDMEGCYFHTRQSRFAALSDVMIQELPPCHGHVSEICRCVIIVACGAHEHYLADVSRVRKRLIVRSQTSRRMLSVLIGRWQ